MSGCFHTLAERKAALEQADLYPVISSEFCDGRSPLDVFRAVAEGGAKLVQIREKNRCDREIYDLLRACRPIADAHGILLIVDDRVDLALAAEADGVHLGQDDLPLSAARSIAPELLLGSSTHNPEEAAASDRTADYLNIGPVYPTQTKTVHCGAVGPEMIRRIAPTLHIPYTVMGGIKAHHIPELLELGVRRIAMVTEITRAPDVRAKVKELRAFWRKG